MAPKQINRVPLVELDLNVELRHLDCDNRDNPQENAPICLPIDGITEFNSGPSYPLPETSGSTNHGFHPLQFDLNSQPLLEEDDAYPGMGLHNQATNGKNVEDTNDVDDDNITLGLSQEENHKKRKDLCNNERRVVYQMLLKKSVDGRLSIREKEKVVSLFSVSLRTIHRIWAQGKNSHFGDVSNKRQGNCGRNRKLLDLARFRDIPIRQRTTLDSIAFTMNTNKTTLWRNLRARLIRRHSNAIKPSLTEENRRSRLKFCLSLLEDCSIPRDPIFMGLYNIVYIDEKWFYMTNKCENYYLRQEEEDLERSCKSKNFNAKVMFLAVLARPRFDAQGNETFSGKIGIFPFVTREPAKRTSRNRVTGTMEIKALTSVKKQDIRSVLIERVIPAIKEKWPREDLRYPIFIQQDNARTHVDQDDEEFYREAKEDGLIFV